MAISPSYQKQGLGTKLINASLDKLRDLGACGCVVLGDPRYYRRFGFKASPQLALADVPPQYFMALLWEGVMPKGEVQYHQAFFV